MATRTFQITKQHVLAAFKPLASPDPAVRAKFMNETLRPDVQWTITGSGHALAGTRTSVKDHNEASWARLGRFLTGPIIFTVLRVLIDNGDGGDVVVQQENGGSAMVISDGDDGSKDGEEEEQQQQWAAVEMKGDAVVKAISVVVAGRRGYAPEWKYENEYCMLTRWDGEGRIVEVRSFHDTALAARVLEGERVEQMNGQT